jgi:hypothetical protein
MAAVSVAWQLRDKRLTGSRISCGRLTADTNFIVYRESETRATSALARRPPVSCIRLLGRRERTDRDVIPVRISE